MTTKQLLEVNFSICQNQTLAMYDIQRQNKSSPFLQSYYTYTDKYLFELACYIRKHIRECALYWVQDVIIQTP